MKKLICTCGVILSCITITCSQNIGDFSYNYWLVYQNVILKNDSQKIIKLDGTALSEFEYPKINVAGEISSSIYDLSNKDYYFLIGRYFYKNGEKISELIIENVTSAQGSLILPDIWNERKLYLFSHQGFYSDLFYSIYNLENNTFEKLNEPLVKDASERLHSIFVNNSFRITSTDKSGYLITVILDSSGLHTPKYHAKVLPSQKPSAGMGQIKFSNSGNYIAVIYRWAPSTLFLYKYDIQSDNACLIKVINDGLQKDAFYIEFENKDSCIITNNGDFKNPIIAYDIHDLDNIKSTTVNREQSASKLISIPNQGTYCVSIEYENDDYHLKIETIGECGQVIHSNSIKIDYVYKNSINIPNIPKVIDSILPPIDYPCLQSDEIEYTYRSFDEEFMNMITPNNDGYNDEFSITWPDFWKFSTYKVTIVNRYGQTLFTSQDLNFIWDGKWNGRQVPNGAYYYVVEFNEKILGHKVFTGIINVID